MVARVLTGFEQDQVNALPWVTSAEQGLHEHEHGTWSMTKLRHSNLITLEKLGLEHHRYATSKL